MFDHSATNSAKLLFDRLNVLLKRQIFRFLSAVFDHHISNLLAHFFRCLCRLCQTSDVTSFHPFRCLGHTEYITGQFCKPHVIV